MLYCIQATKTPHKRTRTHVQAHSALETLEFGQFSTHSKLHTHTHKKRKMPASGHSEANARRRCVAQEQCSRVLAMAVALLLLLALAVSSAAGMQAADQQQQSNSIGGSNGLSGELLNIESRDQKDGDDLSSTIKYLEKLDKYFSQISRPR